MGTNRLAWCVCLALLGCASPTPDNTTLASVKIPVDDAKTKTIPGELYEPIGPGPYPAVIVLGGCGGAQYDTGIVRNLNADYLPRSIATLVIDSLTPRGYREVCSSNGLIDEGIVFGVRDVASAVAWLAKRPEIDAKRIYLQGYSHGARVAIAATDTRAADDALRGRPPVERPRLAGVIAYYPYCFAETQFSVPTKILIGEKDDWTPAPRCLAIADKTNVDITVYPNALHSFAQPGLSLTTYLGHHLGHDPAATADAQQRAVQFIRSTGLAP